MAFWKAHPFIYKLIHFLLVNNPVYALEVLVVGDCALHK